MRVKDAIGRFGEQVAVDHLVADGMIVLDRNWRCRAGELDVVALDGAVLVVVEVKTRSSVAFGVPAESVTPAKASRIRRLAAQWMAEHRAEYDRPGWPELRFDVVAVVGGRGAAPEVEHVRAAF
jgi:putative endonuclease